MPRLERLEDADPDEPAVPHQRVGAYGVLLRYSTDAPQILMTRIAQKDYGAGLWTLPGGGIDHGEDPADGVVREFHEETSLRVQPGDVRFVHSAHFLGRNRAGVLEDFHGLGVVYDVSAARGQDLDDLQILEVDSSTDLVEWLNLADIFDPEADELDRGYSGVAAAAIRDVYAEVFY
ncbi:ADP-ribose pyrophosphatase YjhB (NUDIX family) [Antricoccus suffuscus]|uniref:ADP-ribose pyrophosphatase YjhB (NUDIX family) n=1 Tax=Antricoccus suffuscus TaxID=1629062 RepID=A0A2T0Z209_9ACTN|nr:NUDIX domain-containing protein [Antricoccus suffuscus]PRZ30194.1 ADP-ribose pyrophosphatase YjhB (NUDIX family) [Antricoccus suffuscus]